MIFNNDGSINNLWNQNGESDHGGGRCANTGTTKDLVGENESHACILVHANDYGLNVSGRNRGAGGCDSSHSLMR